MFGSYDKGTCIEAELYYRFIVGQKWHKTTSSKEWRNNVNKQKIKQRGKEDISENWTQALDLHLESQTAFSLPHPL